MKRSQSSSSDLRRRDSLVGVSVEGDETVLTAHELKARQTRQRILDATAEVLSTNGFAGARLSAIAKLAKIQSGAIYHYFESREELVQEAISIGQRMVDSHVRAQLAAMPATSSKLERILTAVEAHLEIVLTRSTYAKAATRNGGQLPDGMAKRYAEIGKTYGILWRDLFVDALEAGEIDASVDLRAARMLIVGALNWAPEWWHPKYGDVDSVIHAARRLVESGLHGR